MYQPLVSIIIPLYNAEKYIGETIQSAIDQTWANKQILVIDDGSTDNSLAAAKQYETAGVTVLSRENTGSGATRNYGLQIAQGEYIQFLDADDLLSSNKIEEQINLLIKNPGKVAVCSTVHFNSNDDPYQSSPTPYEEAFLYDTDNPVNFLIRLYGGEDGRGSMIQTNAWLTPADVIRNAGKWSEFYSPDDDGEFFCRVLLASNGVVYADNCFNYYRKFSTYNNLAGVRTQKAMQGKLQSFLIKKQHLLSAGDSSAIKRALAHNAKELAIDSYLVDQKLSDQFLNLSVELGGTDYVPVLGGKLIELIKKVLGWKLALRLKQLSNTLSIK